MLEDHVLEIDWKEKGRTNCNNETTSTSYRNQPKTSTKIPNLLFTYFAQKGKAR